MPAELKAPTYPILDDIEVPEKEIAEQGVDLALPLSLIAGELVTNSFRHAFPGSRSGIVTFTVSEERDGQIAMTISDNGQGFPEGFNPAESGMTGHTLIRILVQQVCGKMSYMSRGKGASFVITVPRNAESDKSGVREL